MNYIITKHPEWFSSIGQYSFCPIEDMLLPGVIAIDSETLGLQARHFDMFCVQIGTGKNNYLIKLYGEDEYTFYDVIPYIEGKTLVFHNGQFDLGFFYKYNFFPKEVRDTYLASRILYNGSEEVFTHDFKNVMERELSLVYDKTEQKNIHTVKLSVPSTIQYCFNDVDKLLALHDALETKLIEGDYMETYMLHCSYIRALAYMEQCGLPISSKKWKEKMLEDEANVAKWKTHIEEYIFDNIPEFRESQLDLFDDRKKITVNISSPLQMVEVFKKFDIPVLDKDGKESINENIISKSKHEFVKIWLAFQEANHRVTTFGDKIYQQIENERLYTNFNPMVDTARLATRKGYINFLNFPSDEKTRDCFVANEGNVMVVCDFSGQETVVAADLSGDEAMTNSVLHDADLHSAFARVLFPELKDLSDDEIKTKHKKERQDSKAPRFCFQYGGNSYTLHLNEGIPIERAVEIEKAFKTLHYGLYIWGASVFEQSIITGTIESADGWKLHLPKFKKFNSLKESVESLTKLQWTCYKQGKAEWKEEQENPKYKIKDMQCYKFYKEKKKLVSDYFKLKSEYMRLCLNSPVQSRSAHQLKRASVILFDWIVDNNLQWKVKLCNSIHDELVLECLIELSETVTPKLQECMIEGGNYYLSNLTIKAEAHSGDSWFKAK